MFIVILVVAHKKFKPVLLPDCYKIIKVGDDYELISYDYCDNTGCNIHSENKIYNELTATYWAWKNLSNCEILGINHYRRYFFKNIYSHNIDKTILNDKNISKIFRKKEVIIPNYHKKYGQANFVDLTNTNDWITLLYRSVEKCSPQYSKLFIKYISLGYFAGGNMLIAKKEHFNSYCEWLFCVLDDFMKNFNLSNKNNERRAGYAAEYLTDIYFLYNFSEKQIKRFDVINIDNNRPSLFKFILQKFGIIKMKRFIVSYYVRKKCRKYISDNSKYENG